RGRPPRPRVGWGFRALGAATGRRLRPSGARREPDRPGGLPQRPVARAPHPAGDDARRPGRLEYDLPDPVGGPPVFAHGVHAVRHDDRPAVPLERDLEAPRPGRRGGGQGRPDGTRGRGARRGVRREASVFRPLVQSDGRDAPAREPLAHRGLPAAGARAGQDRHGEPDRRDPGRDGDERHRPGARRGRGRDGRRPGGAGPRAAREPGVRPPGAADRRRHGSRADRAALSARGREPPGLEREARRDRPGREGRRAGAQALLPEPDAGLRLSGHGEDQRHVADGRGHAEHRDVRGLQPADLPQEARRGRVRGRGPPRRQRAALRGRARPGQPRRQGALHPGQGAGGSPRHPQPDQPPQRAAGPEAHRQRVLGRQRRRPVAHHRPAGPAPGQARGGAGRDRPRQEPRPARAGRGCGAQRTPAGRTRGGRGR
ncbi:hypothetical protein HK102_011829, partial [Quaeritorhiza haematococci]